MTTKPIRPSRTTTGRTEGPPATLAFVAWRDHLRTALAAAADSERAPQQQAYMKSALPFWGARVPEVRSITNAAIRRLALADAVEWEQAIRRLWDDATHREEWYAAIALLRSARARAWRDASVWALLEHLVVSGAWWDVVDELSHVARERLDRDFDAAAAVVRAWSRDSNLWKRRIAIIAQLHRKEATDRELLAECIEPSLDSSEFFLRKAIGWALRDYSATDPDWVVDYVSRHEARLSALSRKEALRGLK